MNLSRLTLAFLMAVGTGLPAWAGSFSAAGTARGSSATGRPNSLPTTLDNFKEMEAFAARLAAPGLKSSLPEISIQVEVKKNPQMIGTLAELARNGQGWQQEGALTLLAASQTPEARRAFDAFVNERGDVPPSLQIYRHFLEDPKSGYAQWSLYGDQGMPQPPSWWIESMGLFDGPDFLPDLERSLRLQPWRPIWKVPVAALAARLGSDFAAGLLFNLARSKEDAVSLSAIEALGEILDRFSQAAPEIKERTLSELRGFIHSQAKPQRVAAARALSHLQEKLPQELRGRVEGLLAGSWANLGGRPQDRIPHVRALGRIGTEKIVPMIESVLRSEDFDLREAAARARRQIWARRDFNEPGLTQSSYMTPESVQWTPAYVIQSEEGSDWFTDTERLDWAIRQGVVKAIGPFTFEIEHKTGRIITRVEKRIIGGDPALNAKFKAQGYDTEGLFLVPMRRPHRPERYSKVHGRSFYSKTGEPSAVFKNIGGIKLTHAEGLGILFDKDGHGGGQSPGYGAYVSRKLDTAFSDTKKNPSAELAAGFGAGRDAVMEHAAVFYPAAIPVSYDEGPFSALLPIEDFKKKFPDVEISHIYLYQSVLPVRTEEIGSPKDSLEATSDWLPLLSRHPGAGTLKNRAVSLLDEIAARKGLVSYIFHQQWGVPMGWPNVRSGNQILSTHNKNPLTHFDLDSVYTKSYLNKEEPGIDADVSINRHIHQEIRWLAREIILLGRDLLLSPRETLRATALFYHVLLADRLAGISGSSTPALEAEIKLVVR